jgi:RHS repeat-associated protein
VKRSGYDPATGRLVVERFFDNPQTEQAENPAWTLSYTYDASGRVVRQTRVSAEGTEVWSWSFDEQGRQIRAVSPTGTIGYEYDALGRKTRTWAADVPAGALADPLAELASDTRYEYDAFGRLSTLRVLVIAGETLSGTEMQTTRYQYDLDGRLVRQTNPNGTIALHAYDTLGRLTKLTHYAPDTTPQDLSNNAKLVEFDDEHNAAGQRTSTTETFWFDGDDPDTLPEVHTSEIDWTYDAAGRLVDEVFNHYDDALDQSQHFAYDLAGNRLSRSVDLGSNATLDQVFIDTYDANDRQLTSTETAGTSVKTTTFAYDLTQVVSKTTESGGTVLGGWTYAWDAAGRLAVVGELDGTGLKSRTTYGYDPTGIRISATTESQFTGSVAGSTVRTEFLVDHANFTGYQKVIRETHSDASGTLQRTVDYTFGHDEISQTSVDYANGQPSEPVTLTFAHDGHGSVRALFDTAAAIATIAGVRQIFAYDAYGNALGFTPTQAATTLLYSGEQFDQRAQMQYLRARYYDANAGRFVGLDRFAGNAKNPQSYNKYLYVHGDPVNGIDPAGLEHTAVGSINVSGGIASATNVQGGIGLQVMETILSIASGATAHSALISVTALNAGLAGLPIFAGVLAKAIGFIGQHIEKLKLFMPRVGNELLIPGLWGVCIKGEIGQAALKQLFDTSVRASLNKGSREVLKAEYKALMGIAKAVELGSDIQVHHIIPQSMKSHPLMRSIGLNIDSALNALPLTTAAHSGWQANHSSYNVAVRRCLDDIAKAGGTKAVKQQRVLSLMNNATNGILEGRTLAKTDEILSSDDWYQLLKVGL